MDPDPDWILDWVRILDWVMTMGRARIPDRVRTFSSPPVCCVDVLRFASVLWRAAGRCHSHAPLNSLLRSQASQALPPPPPPPHGCSGCSQKCADLCGSGYFGSCSLYSCPLTFISLASRVTLFTCSYHSSPIIFLPCFLSLSLSLRCRIFSPSVGSWRINSRQSR